MKKLIAIFGLVALAACAGEEAAEVETTEVDAVAEPAPGAVVTPPVTPAPAVDPAMDPAMPMDGTTDTMAMPADSVPAM